MNKFKRYAVFGQPVHHSLSPNIYNILFAQNNITAKYIRIAEHRPAHITHFFEEFSLAGANIMSPAKESMLHACHSTTTDAQTIGAVNVVVRQNEQLLGFNTDWEGALGAIYQDGQSNFGGLKQHFNFDTARVLIIGAGAAATAAIYGITNFYKNNTVTISSRTYSKAAGLATRFQVDCVPLEALTPDFIAGYNIILYACADHIYCPSAAPEGTQLIVRCDYTNPALYSDLAAGGWRVLSGLGWLKHQAVASFEYYSKGSEFCRKIDFTDAHSAAIRQRDATAPIVLCGFSGSGKSYLLKQIAHQFNRASCLDIDNIIEQRIGLPIDEVVQSIGWANFRPLETSILRQHIHIPKAVLALGAGGLTIPENRAIIRSLGSRVIYVYSGLKSCLARIRTGSRPLLLNKTDAELEALYEERKFLYFDNSDLIINNE